MFVGDDAGEYRFEPAERPPADVGVGRLLAAVRRRIKRLVGKHGIELEGEFGPDDMDQLALEPLAAAAALPLTSLPGFEPEWQN